MKKEQGVYWIDFKDVGKYIIVRPLQNNNDNILSYYISDSNDKRKNFRRNICFAFVDDEFCIFRFGQSFKNILTDDLFSIDSKKAIKINVGSTTPYRDSFLTYNYEIIEDFKYLYQGMTRRQYNDDLTLESIFNKERYFYSMQNMKVEKLVDEIKFKTLAEFEKI